MTVYFSPGDRVGRLVLKTLCRDKRGQRAWNVECDCGTKKVVSEAKMRPGGKTRACGCLRRERSLAATTRHGFTPTDPSKHHPLYCIWGSMKARCYRAKTEMYPLYGGRGIRVCDSWLHSFPAFLADVGERPTPKHQLERKDNNGHYEPGNVRWATSTEQGRNKRSNVILTFKGKTQCVSAWAEEIGLNPMTLGYRIRAGWPVEEALTRPSDSTQRLRSGG